MDRPHLPARLRGAAAVSGAVYGGNEHSMGRVVVARFAQGEDNFVGVVRAYLPSPAFAIEVESGHEAHWLAYLCREATPEEAAAYWQRRAEAAEAKLRGEP